MNQQFQMIFFLLLIVALVVFLLWFFIFKVKHLKTSDVYMVDGGVKTGKSLVTVMLAVKRYRRNLIKAKIFNVFRKFFNLFRKKDNKKEPIEMPMLYSNMPLYNVKYNKLTMSILKWEVRIPHKSVVLIDEATLLADSLTGMQTNRRFGLRYGDKEYIQAKIEMEEKMREVDEVLTLFLKTFGHQTHGGACFYNSQQVVDLHFAFKRCTSTYLFISKNRKFLFFSLLDVRELIHDESGDVINVNTKDVDDDNKPLFVSRRWYKYYDRYYLDVLTKNLPVYVDYDVVKVPRYNHIELGEILTLGNYKKIREYNESKQKKPVEVKQDEKK